MPYYTYQVKTSNDETWDFWEGSTIYNSYLKSQTCLTELIDFMNSTRGCGDAETKIDNYRVVLIDSVH
jgi:hypothetical protein